MNHPQADLGDVTAAEDLLSSVTNVIIPILQGQEGVMIHSYPYSEKGLFEGF